MFIGYSSVIPLITDVVKRKFETLDKNSPNIGITNPDVIVFEVKKESNQETQQIMDILIQKAMID